MLQVVTLAKVIDWLHGPFLMSHTFGDSCAVRQGLSNDSPALCSLPPMAVAGIQLGVMDCMTARKLQRCKTHLKLSTFYASRRHFFKVCLYVQWCNIHCVCERAGVYHFKC